MERQFIERYKRKSKEELQQIISNSADYRKEAVMAAEKLLVDINVENRGSGKVEKVEYERSGLSESFKLSFFVRSFSYRDILTIISSALLCESLFQIMEYYRDETAFLAYYSAVKIILVFAFIVFNHVVYFKEHKRSNSLLGRSVMDTGFLLSLMLIHIVGEYMIYDRVIRYTMNILGTVVFTIFFIVSIFSLEMILGLIKYGLIKLKCQIF
ncbi:hypothetical protein [Echinicola rosea]|uniref:Uncharacterized protein n=1 Tax=Echinicola rosea TaxID=1807691 RepID=A0ABQ1UN58_9BACT|nr:hypothetical protein [Echinicola rosea]GGF21405.1 hypothetical protein GCM10011339_06790 [Echinicola rosea]